LSSEVDEKLTELVRKCEELYDMSNKKYSDCVWKEKLWEQIGEELKQSVTMIFYCAFLSYYHSIIIDLRQYLVTMSIVVNPVHGKKNKILRTLLYTCVLYTAYAKQHILTT
jgi:hypothetical protein